MLGTLTLTNLVFGIIAHYPADCLLEYADTPASPWHVVWIDPGSDETLSFLDSTGGSRFFRLTDIFVSHITWDPVVACVQPAYYEVAWGHESGNYIHTVRVLNDCENGNHYDVTLQLGMPWFLAVRPIWLTPTLVFDTWVVLMPGHAGPWQSELFWPAYSMDCINPAKGAYVAPYENE